jgi:UDP-glucose 4-epimerase
MNLVTGNLSTGNLVLVTGGAGFIGSHIVEKLLGAGFVVEVIDDLSSGSEKNLPPNITLHKVDIRSKECRELVKEKSPKMIVHAAAQMSVRQSMEDPSFDTHVNVYGLINILQAFHGTSVSDSTLPYFVFLSTGGAIYGDQKVFPCSEDHEIKPESVYGLAKRVSELYLDLWQRQFGLKYVSLRLGNVYGPRQNPHGEAGVVAIFLQKLFQGKTPQINGSGKQTRDFIFVDDVANAVLAAIKHNALGEYNIGTGRETSVNELYKLIVTASGVDMNATYAPAKAGEQMRSSIDNTRAFKAFAWKPVYEISEGLGITAKWFKSHSSVEK